MKNYLGHKKKTQRILYCDLQVPNPSSDRAGKLLSRSGQDFAKTTHCTRQHTNRQSIPFFVSIAGTEQLDGDKVITR